MWATVELKVTIRPQPLYMRWGKAAATQDITPPTFTACILAASPAVSRMASGAALPSSM